MFNKEESLAKFKFIFDTLELDSELEKRIINNMKRAYREFQAYQQDKNIVEEIIPIVDESPLKTTKKTGDQKTAAEGDKFRSRMNIRNARKHTDLEYLDLINDPHITEYKGIVTRQKERVLLAELKGKINQIVDEPEVELLAEKPLKKASRIGAAELMELLESAAYFQYKLEKTETQRLFAHMNASQKCNFLVSRPAKKLPIEAVLNGVTKDEWNEFIAELKQARNLTPSLVNTQESSSSSSNGLN